MDKIAVLDFGGQYAHLISNRIRRLGVYCEIRYPETPAQFLTYYKGIIFSGGPKSVFEPDAPKCDRKIFQLGIPVLGICYGHHLIAHMLGGQTQSTPLKEYGFSELEIARGIGIFRDLKLPKSKKLQVWMSHGDEVTKLPNGFIVIGKTADCKNAAIANIDRRIFGVQFHPEVTHTEQGTQILENFVEMCQARRQWSIENHIEYKIKEIRTKVGDKKVFMLISGGVDSTVAFMMLQKALGPEKVFGLFIDTGFLRLNEEKEGKKAFESLGAENVHFYDAKDEFFNNLKEIYDPEEKRKIIGQTFLDIKDKVTAKLGLNPQEWLLGQGTIYPDTIETGGTKHADKIKTHHNRVERIENLIRKGKIIEPLSQLYKDEVREVGRKLQIPEEIILRHPFPGPGLAVRALCAKGEVYPEELSLLQRQIGVLLSETELHGRILPIKSVGVQGDSRTYANPLAITGDTSFEELEKVSTQLTNQFREINRVIYAIGVSDIDTIEVKNKYLTPERIELLQKADKIVMDIVKEKELYDEIWQFPVVLIPVAINGKGEESIVLRPVCSTEAMTANFAKIDLMAVFEMKKQLEECPGISAVFYDVTNKPPGTIEWE